MDAAFPINRWIAGYRFSRQMARTDLSLLYEGINDRARPVVGKFFLDREAAVREAKVLRSLLKTGAYDEEPYPFPMFSGTAKWFDGNKTYHVVVMSLVRGCNLNDFILERTPQGKEVVRTDRLYSPSEAAALAINILGALRYLWHIKTTFAPGYLVHLDMKPQNVMLNGFCKTAPVLIDSASGYSLQDEKQSLTLAYAAPEVIYHRVSPECRPDFVRPVDYRADLYSLSLLLYFALTGEVAYLSNGNDAAVVEQKTQDKVVPAINERIGEHEIYRLLHRMAFQDADQRLSDVIVLQQKFSALVN